MSGFTTDVAQSAHKRCTRHRPELFASDSCGCFYCLAVFSPGEIVDWCDNGETALCPRCGIDSVVGDASGFPVSDAGFLNAMKDYWF